MGRLLSRKEEDQFLSRLVRGAEISKKAAVCLAAAWDDDNHLNYEKIREVKEIEHMGDQLVHESLLAIEKAFITPIDRGDLLDLMQAIENVTDTIDEISSNTYMMNIQRGDKYTKASLDFILESTEYMHQLMIAFSTFKKSRKEIDHFIIEINRVEELGDLNHVEAMRNLYTTCDNPIDVIRFQTLYTLFEKCHNTIEDVADIVSTVLISSN